MADERDEQETQTSQETAVGHSVVEDAGAQQADDGADTGETAAVDQPAGTEAGDQTAGAEATEVFFSRDAAQEDPTVSGPPTPPTPSSEPEGGGTSPAEADRIATDQQDAFAQKPHLYAAGAFVGAFVFAQILKRITGGGGD